MPRSKPTLYLSAEDLPAIKGWSVGKDYDIVLKVRMTGMSERERGLETGKKEKTINGDFEVLKASEGKEDYE